MSDTFKKGTLKQRICMGGLHSTENAITDQASRYSKCCQQPHDHSFYPHTGYHASHGVRNSGLGKVLSFVKKKKLKIQRKK